MTIIFATSYLYNTDDCIPLVHPKLIDWDQQGPLSLDHFENDEAIKSFLESHKDILVQFGESTPSSSHKNENEKNENNKSLGENRKASLDIKKIKINDVSKGENLFEVRENRRIIKSLVDHEKHPLLVEITQEINLGMLDNPKVIYFATSMSKQEKAKFITFFLENQVNFTWSYADMPRID